MTGLKKKVLALVTSAAVLASLLPSLSLSAQADTLSENVTAPFTSSTTFTTSDGTSHTSASWRIPSVVMLKDGTLVAASDARYNTTYDGGGTDTVAAYSKDGGVTWTTAAANYLPDNGDTYNASSTAFIDPSLLTASDGQRVYMLTDLFPGGIALNGSGNTAPSSEKAFDDSGYLKLSKGTAGSYSYYLKDGKIYDYATNTDQGYTVDDHFYVYKDSVKAGNLFYSETAYTYETEVSDEASGGETANASSENASAASGSTEVIPASEAAASYEAASQDGGASVSEDTLNTAEDTSSGEASETADAVSGDEVNTAEASGKAYSSASGTDGTVKGSSDDTAADNAGSAISTSTISGTSAVSGTSVSGTSSVSSVSSAASSVSSASPAAAVNESTEGESEEALNTTQVTDDAFKVVPTAYLSLTYSDDGGATWSAPTLLNLKTASELACLVGPGTGITTSDGLMVFPVYSYNGSADSQRTGFIYSTDGTNWLRADNAGVSWSSEASAVEISGTKLLRFFYRNSTGKLCYVDYNRETSAWGSEVKTDLNVNSNTQLSAISYSEKANGRQVILVSAPAGPGGSGSTSSDASARTNGRIFVGAVDNSDNTMSWIKTINVNDATFIYSSLTERSDGSVALLYENSWSGWGTGNTCGMNLTTVSEASLGLDQEVDVALTFGDPSESYAVGDGQIGTAGWHTTDDGCVAYKISYGETTSQASDFTAGGSYKLKSGDTWLAIENGVLSATEDASKAAVWTAVSGTDSRGWGVYYLSADGYYLGRSSGNAQLLTGEDASSGGWWFSSGGSGMGYDNGNGSTWSYLFYDSEAGVWKYGTTDDDTTHTYLYDESSQSSTTVKFSGLDITKKTAVNLGDKTFYVTVNNRDASLSKAMNLNGTLALNALTDMGALAAQGTADELYSEAKDLVPVYTATYHVSSDPSSAIVLGDGSGDVTVKDDSSVMLTGQNAGNALVTVSIKHPDSGNTVATITYHIQVGDREEEYLSFEVGDTSDPILVGEGELAEEGWYTTSDGVAAYKISYGNKAEAASSLSDGESFKIRSGAYWMKLEDGVLTATDNASEAASWTAHTSTTSSGSYYLESDGKILSHGSSVITLVDSEDDTTCWWHNDGGTRGLFYSGGDLSYDSDTASWIYGSTTEHNGEIYTTSSVRATYVQFVGLDTTTTTTTVQLGMKDFKLIITPKSKTVRHNCRIGETDELNGAEDLGVLLDTENSVSSLRSEALSLTTPSYQVSYELTDNADGAVELSQQTDDQKITAEGVNYGDAVIVGTVVNQASSHVVGYVTYEIRVDDITLTDIKTIYVPVGKTAVIEGLQGEIRDTRGDGAKVTDTSIATISPENGTVLDNESLTITGVKEGTTQVLVGTVGFNICVVNAASSTNSRYLYVYIDEMTHTTVYYSINGSALRQVEGQGVLIDQTFNSGVQIMFFAAPDDGYALTYMSLMDSANQYYTISNGTRTDGADSDGWPLTDPDTDEIPSSSSSTWKNIGLKWGLLEGNITIPQMRAAFTDALAKGCDGVAVVTKNDAPTAKQSFYWDFVSEKLPTLEKTLVSYKRDGVTYDYKGEALQWGDILTYRFDITHYSSSITYSDTVLKDEPIGFTQNLSDSTPSGTGVTTVYASEAYTVSKKDVAKYLGARFKNVATLDYSYKTDFSQGTLKSEATATVSVPIAGVVGYAWADSTPDEIKNDTDTYPLPSSEIVAGGDTFDVAAYEGKTTYEVVEDGIKKGTWTFTGTWQYDSKSYAADGTASETMPMAEEASFIGYWTYESAPRYTVTYQWSEDSRTPKTVYLPRDTAQYYEGETYHVHDTYTEGYTYTDESYIYTFSGWKDDEDKVLTGDQVMEDENVTLTGTWTRVPNAADLTIKKLGAEDSDDQTFLFTIKGGDVDMTVTVHGNDQVILKGLAIGETYTVTEVSEWSWRYTAKGWSYTTTTEGRSAEGETKAAVIQLGSSQNVITFTNSRTNTKWLDGNADSVNIYQNS